MGDGPVAVDNFMMGLGAEPVAPDQTLPIVTDNPAAFGMTTTGQPDPTTPIGADVLANQQASDDLAKSLTEIFEQREAGGPPQPDNQGTGNQSDGTGGGSVPDTGTAPTSTPSTPDFLQQLLGGGDETDAEKIREFGEQLRAAAGLSSAGGEPTGDGAGAPTAPQQPPQQQYAQPTVDDIARAVYGRPLTPEEAYNVFLTADRFGAATPQQRAQLEAILNGQQEPITLPPGGPVPGIQGLQPQTYQQQQIIDPEIAQVVSPLQQQIEQLRAEQQALQANMAQQAQQQLAQQRAQLANGIAVGVQEFTKEYSLPPDEMAQLQAYAANSGLADLYFNQTGDPVRATKQALEHAFWNNDKYRDAMVDLKLLYAWDQMQQDMARQYKAASVAPAGTNAPREQQPQSQQEQMAALTEGLREAMAQMG